MRSSRRRPALAELALLLILGASLGSCSTRDHINPFDPDNPGTHGRPKLLTAVAGEAAVQLSWEIDPFDDVTSFRLARTSASGASQVLADSLAPTARSYQDLGAINDTTYDYVLSVAIAGRADWVATPGATATPGRRVIWVLEGRRGSPLQVSPDGRQLLGRRGQGSPGRFDIDPTTGEVVTADDSGRLERYGRDGSRLSVTTFRGLLAMALIPGGGAWVSALEPGRMVRLAADLQTVITADTLAAQWQELAYDSRTGDVWASDVLESRLFHRRKDGGLTALVGLSLPLALAIDAKTGDCWVVDRRARQVLRVDARTDTVVARAGGFDAPLDLAADPSGGVWVADAGRREVILLSESGAEVAHLRGFERPYAVAVDPNGIDIWVADAAADELVRVDRSGLVLQRLGGLFSPFAVAVATPPPSRPGEFTPHPPGARNRSRRFP